MRPMVRDMLSNPKPSGPVRAAASWRRGLVQEHQDQNFVIDVTHNIAMRARKALRISQVGLRGVVGAGLTAGHVIDFASAFGTFVEPGRPVLLGRDPRASGA